MSKRTRTPDAKTLCLPRAGRKIGFRLPRIHVPRAIDDPAKLKADQRRHRGRARNAPPSRDATNRERKRRIQKLRRQIEHELADQKHVITNLIDCLLLPSTRGGASFANPVFFRKVWRRVVGEISRLCRKSGQHPIVVYTVAWSSARRSPNGITHRWPKQCQEALRAHLTRTGGIARRSGWMICFFDCDYCTRDGLLQPHFYIVASGDKAMAIEALRKLDTFKGGRGKIPYRPIVRQELVEPLRQLAYGPKGWWASVDTYIAGNGAVHRDQQKHRLPEPLHTQVLLLLHDQHLSDLIWLHGIQIKKGRLVPVKQRGRP